MDNLYPTVPTNRKKGYPLFDRFKQEMNQQDLYDQIADPRRYEQQLQNNIPPPSVTKPMDVIFDQGNISETSRALGAAKTIHGVDLSGRGASEYQRGQLLNKNRELDLREQGVQETAEMGEWKRANPGGQIIKQPDGKILKVGPGGQILGEFGPSGVMAEERKIGVNQQNAIQRLDRGGEIAGAVEDKRQYGRSALQGQRDLGSMARTQVTAGNKPIGSTRDVNYKYGPGGEIIGATSNTKQIMPPPPQSIRGNAAMMYGPDGKQYPVPIENTDEAQEKYGMTFTPTRSTVPNRSGGPGVK